MKKIIILLILYSNYIVSQENNYFNLQKTYVSIDLNYRSYGTNDHINSGIGIEVSKEFNKWIGFGVKVNYFKDRTIDWDFVNPFTNQRYIYTGVIEDISITPFIQFIPINTKYFDFYFQLGPTIANYYQENYLGGYNTSYSPQQFNVFIYDLGDKGLDVGLNTSISLRFQFSKIIFVPSVSKSMYSKGNGFDELSLKIGYQF